MTLDSSADRNSDRRSSFVETGAGASRGRKKTTVAGVIVALLIGGYTLLRPAINEATGWNLPAPSTATAPAGVDSDRTVVPPKTAPSQSPSPIAATPAKSSPGKTSPAKSSTAGGSTSGLGHESRSPSPKTSSPGPLAGRPAAAAKPNADLRYGLLREIGRDRFLSPAGLMYGPGSAEGHRLEHLRRHVEDQPTRPGKHGVFDGGMAGALALIDQAFEKARAGVRTTTTEEDGRTVYTVDMGKRVGFIGGRDGNRQRLPMARRIRLVIDGNQVITAFPM